MNKHLNLCEILKDCPKGTKLWSPVWGRVTFETIDAFDGLVYVLTHKGVHITLDSDGKFDTDGECILFPSKEQRDWSKFERFWDKPKVDKFDVNTLQPFDKVLVRVDSKSIWEPDFFGYKGDEYNTCVMCISDRILVKSWEQCIPYNEETKHLVGTREDCPEYYKWWEE